ncbi:MAG: hypothetical protein H0V12_09400, partial [Chloroflexi bacterium]|nr:hypothetical protein [Chloroflexota bacterium]
MQARPVRSRRDLAERRSRVDAAARRRAARSQVSRDPDGSDANYEASGASRSAGQDGRRLAAAFLSSLYPGLGQAFNRHGRLALAFALPITAVLLLLIVAVTSRPAELLAALFRPDTLLILLFLNLLILGARLVAVSQAFVWGGSGRIGRTGALGLALVLAWTVAPQAAAGYLGLQLRDAAGAICVRCVGGGGAGAEPRPFFPGDDAGSTAGPT